MSPQFIIILTGSLCSLLIVVLFVIRKRAKKGQEHNNPALKPQKTPKDETSKLLSAEELLQDESLEPLESLNLDELEIEEIKSDQIETQALQTKGRSKNNTPLEPLTNSINLETEAILPYENTTSRSSASLASLASSKAEMSARPERPKGVEWETEEEEEADPFYDLIELVNRYKFLQGKNLKKFETYLRENDTDSIETLIREKFLAQGKKNASSQAKEVTKKLLNSVLATGI